MSKLEACQIIFWIRPWRDINKEIDVIQLHIMNTSDILFKHAVKKQ